MANWKVQLLSDDNTLTQLTLAHKTHDIFISKDGTDCFLESTGFAMSSDHNEVRQKAVEIIENLQKNPEAPIAAEIKTGVIYKMHYDNSKTVFRD